MSPAQLKIAVAAGCAVALTYVLPWLVVIVVALLRGRLSRCPRCRSNRVRPAWPRPLETVLPRFVVTQRCEFCRKRFYSAKPVDYTKPPM